MKSNEIPVLIDALNNPNTLQAAHARSKLEYLGREAVPALISALYSGTSQVRWQAVKALQNIYAPEASRAFVDALEDSHAGVRWLAAESLIRLRCCGLVPLLETLVEHPNWVYLQQGAHHVLKGIYLYIPENAQPEIDTLLDLLEEHDNIPAIRQAAAQALGAMEVSV